MPTFSYDGIHFNYTDQGMGVPFIFQHGLGGDVNQPAELCRPVPGIRFIALDCRGHGETRPPGPENKLNFATFAGDVLALADSLGLATFAVGGISMGAGVALAITVAHPDRVRGLVLSRPAWLDVPMPPNLEVMCRVGELIRRHGCQRGRELFLQSEDYRKILNISADVARSLVSQFEHPRAEETAAKLERLPHDAPVRDSAQWSATKVPTLVLGSQRDPVHPYEYAGTLARSIPGAVLKELTPKAVSKEQHTAETQEAIAAFLKQFL